MWSDLHTFLKLATASLSLCSNALSIASYEKGNYLTDLILIC